MYCSSFQSDQLLDNVDLRQVVINTRPIERAAPLTDHLQAAGLTVIDMPMLALEPRKVSETDMTLMRQWLAGDYKALVIVSPTAAASGLAVWQQLNNEAECNTALAYVDPEPKNDKFSDFESRTSSKSAIIDAPSHLIAVGDATAAVLNAAKTAQTTYQVLQPLIANNEGMLAMAEIDSLQENDKLLIWRGLGGRRLLVDTLSARGVQIDSIAWYERVMPNAALAQYQEWLRQFITPAHTDNKMLVDIPKPIVIISSGTAFEHWMSVVNQGSSIYSGLQTSLDQWSLPKLTDFAYVVLGERLANMVAEQQLSYWRVEDLAPATILAAIKS